MPIHTRLGAALLFIVMPAIVVVVGCVTMLNLRRDDQNLRNDTRAALAMVWRNRLTLLLAMPTILAGVILAVVVAHMITD